MKTFILTLSFYFACVCSGQDSITLEQRLNRLVETFEEKREEYHIPGMQLSVVLNDEIVLVHSFGESNVELEQTVTDETLFAIGSATKSFTATAIGILVDDGVMGWDAPIKEYLPKFVLPIEVGDGDDESEVLIRDLLSHRTGFTRMQMLAVNNSLAPEETLAAAINAEPWAPFRSRFLYNNEQYLAAGFASGKVCGSDWNTLVEESLFSPIGMNNSLTSWRRAKDNQVVATGYQWDEDKEVFEAFPLRTIDNIGPAGSIVSTAGDMAQWIRFNLGHGTIDGKKILSEEQHNELWTSQINISSGVDYGLGWMLHKQPGKTVIEHGGNVRGGSAQMAIFPEDNLGFVLLMNVSASLLQQESVSIVKKVMLGDFNSDNEAGTTDLSVYVGEYIGDFASFDGDVFTVQDKDGVLAVDVPRQMLYKLNPPDDEGKWYFTLTDTIAVSFEMDAKKNVVGMKMHQGGMVFELPRDGVEIQPDVPLIELERYLGTFHCDESEITANIVVKNNRLAVDWPEQMIYELFPPNDDGEWAFRATDKIRLRFTEDEQKQVAGFIYLQEGNTISFNRVAEMSKKPVPTVDEILSAYDLDEREAVLKSLGCIRSSGKTDVLQSGIGGSVELWADSAGRMRVENDWGKFGWICFGVVGDVGLMDMLFVEAEELGVDEIRRVLRESPFVWTGNWTTKYSNITLLKESSSDEGATWVLKVEHSEDPPRTITIDQQTGDVIHVESTQLIDAGFGYVVNMPYTQSFADFKEVDGIRIPMTQSTSNDTTGITVSKFNTIETGVDLPDEFFDIEPRPKPDPWVAEMVDTK